MNTSADLSHIEPVNFTKSSVVDASSMAGSGRGVRTTGIHKTVANCVAHTR